MEKEYLGDGVYAEIKEYRVKLTTSNGIEDTNTIWLEDIVLAKFANYINRYHAENRA